MIYHLGTSGWSYPGWRERFYPAGLSSKASEIRKLASRDCYIYFNNGYKAYAIANCRHLTTLLEEES